MFNVEYSTNAKKFLKNMPKRDAEAIVRKITSIKDNPFHHLKKMQGSSLWRLRISQYRAIIDIVIENNKLLVLRVGHRKDIYKKPL